MTRFDSDMSLVNHNDQLCLPAFSKHDLIFCNLNILTQNVEQKNFCYRDFSEIKLELFLKTAGSLNWKDIYFCSSVDEKLNIFNTLTSSFFEKFVQLKIYRKSESACPWFSDHIKALCKKRDFIYSEWKRFRTAEL